MQRPQRHRLLQGYPMAPALGPLPLEHGNIADLIERDPSRRLIVGVLPHTFCNPRVRGCGFCTFPHERFANDRARTVGEHVAREIRDARVRGTRGAKVDAVYFGGGTANLTPRDAFDAIAAATASTFDLGDAEVSLEGVATYFLMRDEAMLDALEAIGARHKRISVGIQTFDAGWREKMGREAFGDEATFAAVVRAAHRRGMTTSCDLLVNLPGEGAARSFADVRAADAAGFDQICVYNLVLDAKLDIPWAHDRSLLASRAPNPQAHATWRAVREELLSLGFEQTTLTNFERRGARRFAYERMSFTPSTYDALGFGPGAISTFTMEHGIFASKWINADTSDAYVAQMASAGHAASRAFDYSPTDLRLLHITRSLSALAIDRHGYERFFGTKLTTDFRPEVSAIVAADLAVLTPGALTLTPRGMFFADSVAGLFAARRSHELRHPNDALPHGMG